MASGGNVKENPHLGILFVDFLEQTIGLHINGKAHLHESGTFDALPDAIQCWVYAENRSDEGRKPAFWFLLEVEEAYMHCAKHIPRLALADKEIDWGTDDVVKKGGDYFNVKATKRKEA
jgi:hypothetical protein